MATGNPQDHLIKLLMDLATSPAAYSFNDISGTNELLIDEKELSKLPDGGDLIRQLRNQLKQKDIKIHELRAEISELEIDVKDKANLLWEQKQEHEEKLEEAYKSIGELKDQIHFLTSRRGLRLR